MRGAVSGMVIGTLGAGPIGALTMGFIVGLHKPMFTD